jgi:DNA-binding NarL/FixJ family response regulator
MMLNGFQEKRERGAPDGLVVCIVAPAPALQVGLSSIVTGLEIVRKVYSTSTLEQFEIYRSITDLLVLVAGDESAVNLEEILAESAVNSVLILASEEDHISGEIADIPDTARGFLPLDAPHEQIEAAIMALAAGLSTGTPESVAFRQDGKARERDEPLIDPLTDRESEVLQLLARGKANKQIARDLQISEHTVKFHISSIYTKLGAGNRTEAVRLGVRRGLVLL